MDEGHHSRQDLPRFFRVRQSFPRPKEACLNTAVTRELEALGIRSQLKPGQTVAITVGSRGIANVPVLVRAVVDWIKQTGAQPWIIPSMGSHGGATAAGQMKVLAELGVTEVSVGAPIHSGLETQIIAEAKEGFPVHFDKIAAQADHILIMNRVKPHTIFTGSLESGLMKMMLIGLGNHAGATIYHQVIKTHSFDQIVRSVGSVVLSRLPILGGLAILENAYEETAQIVGVPRDRFVETEQDCLVEAKKLLPRLPFNELDVLIVDQIGKDISGAGMDTNVIGRKHNDHEARPDEWPKIKRICVRGLTTKTKGNAAGIGIAEFCRSDLLAEMDREATRVNCLTAGHVTAAMIPLDYEFDQTMLRDAIGSAGVRVAADARVARILDTLHLVDLECSEALWQECQAANHLEILCPPRHVAWQGGNFPELACDHGTTDGM